MGYSRTGSRSFRTELGRPLRAGLLGGGEQRTGGRLLPFAVGHIGLGPALYGVSLY
jgi:hypothetical protein